MLNIVINYAFSRKTFKLKKIEKKKIKKKTYFAPDLGPLGPNLGHYFFFQNQALSVTRYYGQLSSCKLSEKTNDSILFGKISDGQTHGLMDRQTDGRE